MNEKICDSWEALLWEALPKIRHLELVIQMGDLSPSIQLENDRLRWVVPAEPENDVQERIVHGMRLLRKRTSDRVKAVLCLQNNGMQIGQEAYAEGLNVRKIVASWWKALGWDPCLCLNFSALPSDMPQGELKPETFSAWLDLYNKEQALQQEGMDYVLTIQPLIWLEEWLHGFYSLGEHIPGHVGWGGNAVRLTPERIARREKWRRIIQLLSVGIACCVLLCAIYGFAMAWRLVGSWEGKPVQPLSTRWLDLRPCCVEQLMGSEGGPQVGTMDGVLPPLFRWALDIPSRLRQAQRSNVDAWFAGTHEKLQSRVQLCLDGNDLPTCGLLLDRMGGMLRWLGGESDNEAEFRENYLLVVRFSLWQRQVPGLPAQAYEEIANMLRWLVPMRPKLEGDIHLQKRIAMFIGKNKAESLLPVDSDSLPYWEDWVLALAGNDSLAAALAKRSYELRLKALRPCLLSNWSELEVPGASTDWGESCIRLFQELRGQLPGKWEKQLGLPPVFFRWMAGIDLTPAVEQWNEFLALPDLDVGDSIILDSLERLALAVRKDVPDPIQDLWEAFYWKPIDRARQGALGLRLEKWMQRYCEERNAWMASMAKTFPFGGGASLPDADLGAVRMWLGPGGRIESLRKEWLLVGYDSLASSAWRTWFAHSDSLRNLIFAAEQYRPQRVAYRVCAGANTEATLLLDTMALRLPAGMDCITGRYTGGLNASVWQLKVPQSNSSVWRFTGPWALQRMALLGSWREGAGLILDMQVKASGFRDVLSSEWTVPESSPLLLQPGKWKLEWPRSPFIHGENEEMQRRCHE